jgi:hypothetical protein
LILTTASLRDYDDVLKEDNPRKATATAKLNKKIMEGLQAALKINPEVDLFSVFPQIYKEQRRTTRIPPRGNFRGKPPGPSDFCADLISRTRTAAIVFPLSNAVTMLLAEYAEPTDTSTDPTQSLVLSLKRMISNSEKLWEGPTRGVVLKCNDELVAKIIRGNNDYTEYTSIQYLAQHAPDIPAPKPHGLVRFGSARIMFMTYFPSMTLEQAWPKLTHENKVLVQHQLNGIFSRLRMLKREGGHRLGGVSGEGVADHHREPHRSDKVITTTAEFEDFQFSASHRGSRSWVNFLRSLLPVAEEGSVFTHGDVRTANIMVKLDDCNNYVVTGIIDWEYSGFYPDYYESSKILFLFDMCTETDWYAYLPACIAPARNPERWLVSKLWNHCINYS